MSDLSAFHFPYHGFSVPNGIPFYPKIKEVDGAKKVSFNQGYVFDFTSARGNKGVRKIKVVGCDKEYEAALNNTELQKELPTSNVEILDQHNVNTAFTSTCPVNSEIIVFRKGISQGFNTSIPLGGHTAPISTDGDKLE